MYTRTQHLCTMSGKKSFDFTIILHQLGAQKDNIQHCIRGWGVWCKIHYHTIRLRDNEICQDFSYKLQHMFHTYLHNLLVSTMLLSLVSCRISEDCHISYSGSEIWQLFSLFFYLFFFHYFQLPQTPHQKVKEVELNEVQYGDEQFMCTCSYLKK